LERTFAMLREDNQAADRGPAPESGRPALRRLFGGAPKRAAAPDDMAKAVAVAQAQAVYKSAPVDFLANLLFSLLLVAVLYRMDGEFGSLFVKWFTVLAASIGVRFLLWRDIKAGVNDPRRARKWLTNYTFGTGFTALIWSATLLFIPHGVPLEYVLVVVFLLAAMTASATAAAAAYLPATIAFAAPILIALSLRFASGGGLTNWAMALFALVYLGFVLRLAGNIGDDLVTRVGLNEKNRELVGSLEYSIAETRDREEKFRVIADYSYGWEAWFSADGRLQWVNPGVERITGYTDGECMAQKNHPLEIVHPDDREMIARGLAIAAAKPTKDEIEFRVVHKDGTIRWCSVLSCPAVDSTGSNVGFRASIRDISDRKALQAELEVLASTDPLTGVYNRRRFFHDAEGELYRARRYQRPMVVLMVDIDHFKKLNDGHGHAVGDKCLKALALAFRHRLRRSDIIARLGGEEFVAMLPETQLQDALRLAERLRQLVEAIKIETPSGGEISFTVSLGVADFQPEGDSLNQLLARADSALYKAKRDGRNQVAYVGADGTSAVPLPAGPPPASTVAPIPVPIAASVLSPIAGSVAAAPPRTEAPISIRRAPARA
jgi:diguanylate cyclase (GGDEF)-like protein/PAS domain S-box-containing protein